MENPVIIAWYAKEQQFQPKEQQWFWTVGIVATGAAVAAFIMKDYLFSLIAILGGFTVMLVGSRKPPRHKYSLTERGFVVGQHLMPYSQMTTFAIKEEEPRKLSIGTKTFTGTVTVPLGDADHRVIRMELKNRNIEEVESLDSFVDGVAKRVGL